MTVLSWILRILIILILGPPAVGKLLGMSDAVKLFEQLGAEPAGRYLVGLIELAAIILLLVRPAWGALASAATMAGALLTHFFILGIEINDDGGMMFSMALAAFVMALILAFVHRSKLPASASEG